MAPNPECRSLHSLTYAAGTMANSPTAATQRVRLRAGCTTRAHTARTSPKAAVAPSAVGTHTVHGSRVSQRGHRLVRRTTRMAASVRLPNHFDARTQRRANRSQPSWTVRMLITKQCDDRV